MAVSKRSITVQVLSNRLPQISAGLEAKASEIVRRTALNIEAHAKRIVPVDTGNLKNSIQTAMEPDGLEAEVGTAVEYGPYVEWGTSHQSAQPYLGPAAEAERGPYRKAMAGLVAE